MIKKIGMVGMVAAAWILSCGLVFAEEVAQQAATATDSLAVKAALGLSILSAVHMLMKAIRDAVDKTPATDDNLFERVVTIIGKAVAYVAGKRAE